MTPYPQTTAHERAILEHYFMRASDGTQHVPWKNGSEHWLQVDRDAVKRFVAAGLLIEELAAYGLPMVVGNREALAVYFEALDCVPLPVRVWKIPEFQA